MAKIFKRKGRPGYYVDYYDARGHRVRRKAANTYAESRKLLREIEARVEGERRRYRHGKVSGPRLDVELADLRDTYLVHVDNACRESTARRYRTSINDVIEFLSEQGVRTLGALEPYLLADYCAKRRREVREVVFTCRGREQRQSVGPLSARTVNIHAGVFVRMLRWAKAHGRIEDNPLADWQPVSGPQVKHRRALKEDEIAALLHHSPAPYAFLWRFFLGTGLRKGEVVNLQWRDVELSTPSPRVCVRAEVAKDKSVRIIPLRHDLVEGLRELHERATSEYVFVNRAGRPWRNNLLKRFRWCLKRAGVNPTGVDLHALRVTFATHLVRAGVDPKTVQALLGHATARFTLDLYAREWPASSTEAVDSLPLPDMEAASLAAGREQATG